MFLMRRIWRALSRCVDSPADLWLLTRMTAWAPSLPVLKRALPLPRLVDLMESEPRRSKRDPALERRIARMARLIYRGQPGTFSNNCLERSLVTYRYLSRAGADPELVVAVRRGDEGVDGHVWVTVGGVPVHEQPDELEPYVPVLRFKRGEVTRSAGGAASALPGAQSGAEAKD
jgi:hypothetical protein